MACTNTDSIKTDAASIALGKAIFEQKCSGCHNFRQDAIGPNLSGITARASVAWIKDFIKSPKEVLARNDTQAYGLLKKFKTVMPSFSSFKDDALNDIVAYLATQNIQPEKKEIKDPLALTNPIPQSIALSGLIADLQLITQVPRSANESPFTRIVKMEAAPGISGMFILDQRGILYTFNGHQPAVYLDIKKWKPHFINQPGLATGFGSFAFHPDFVHNGLFYTTHTEAAGAAKADFAYADSIKVAMQWVVTEWKTGNPNAETFSGTNRELLRINMVSGIHGVQEITFNPHAKKGERDYGTLYIGVGDGGSVENGYAFLPHRTNSVWGALLRIDPLGRNSANGKYGIPVDNPFSATAVSNGLGEVYAYGFRNPNRISWTRAGQMLATNIGQSNIESLNGIVKGRDYGWPLREGSFALHSSGDLNAVYKLNATDSAMPILFPVAEYDHDEGKAISGGFEYTGKAVPQLKGKYLFGDVPTGRLFYVDMANLKLGRQATIYEWQVAVNGKPVKLRNLCGNDRMDLHFAKDQNGEMYLLTKPDGKIYKLVNATQTKRSN